MSFQELDMVVLVRDLPDHRLRCGDTGAIVHLHSPDAFEVELCARRALPLPLLNSRPQMCDWRETMIRWPYGATRR